MTLNFEKEKLVKELKKIKPKKVLVQLPEEIRTAVKNNAGGHLNHSFFWTVLKKDVQPSGDVLRAIITDFGSYDNFLQEFKQAAVTQFGSGWAWLVLNPNGNKLEIAQTRDHETPITDGKIPLLVVDVWEHAYYLKYQNRRPEYVDAFINVINWEQVNKNFLEATQG